MYSTAGIKREDRNEFGHAFFRCAVSKLSRLDRVKSSKAAAASAERITDNAFTGRSVDSSTGSSLTPSERSTFSAIESFARLPYLVSKSDLKYPTFNFLMSVLPS